MATWDTIIIGQGLAGTTLAWQLHAAGQRVLVVDRGEKITSSKIAAGLITPITGQRIALSWCIETFLPAAREFYRSVETLTNSSFFHDRRAVRLFTKDDERERWQERCGRSEFARHLSSPQPNPLLEVDLAETSGGGFEMQTAQLDVAAYLLASMRWWEGHGCHTVAKVDWKRDVKFSAEGASVLDHHGRRVVACEGYAAVRNPYFDWVPFKAAKGDILTVKFSMPLPPRAVHAGIWMAPTRDPQVFRVGSTYEWVRLDQEPEEEQKIYLSERLRSLVKVPFEVIDHQAAVRPIIHESKALLGMHPSHDCLGYFNGLGSKGSLHAPWFAGRFADFLVGGVPIPMEIDIQKNY